MIGRIVDRRIVTYGLSPQADVHGANLRPAGHAYEFDVVIRDRVSGATRSIDDVFLPMVGRHNVTNALAAVAVAQEMGIDDAAVVDALRRFEGVKRRFTKTGEVGGITVIDDYGHHPVEIAAVLGAARDAFSGRVIAVVQPHRFTRLRDLFDDFCACFNDADAVIVADVYSAGETPIEGIDRDALAEGLRARGHRQVDVLANPGELAQKVAAVAEHGDVVICLGAGSISAWANELPEQLALLVGERVMSAGART
jgi:UDP-N-acetylmuramate--alanine ligase